MERLVSLPALVSRWWVLVVRGLAAIALGVLLFLAPGRALLSLVLLWGAYALVDGVFNLALAASGGANGRGGSGWLAFEAIVSITAGVLTFGWPRITAIGLLAVIAGWSVMTGIAEIAFAIRLRKVIRGEWLLILSGVLSLAFAVLLFAFPWTGALVLAWWLGAYAIAFGALLVGLGFRLHSFSRAGGPSIPTGEHPIPA